MIERICVEPGAKLPSIWRVCVYAKDRRAAMRNRVLAVSAVFLCSASASWGAGPVDPAELRSPVHLDSPADLAQLRERNPEHYARAVRLLAAANRLCKPGQPKLQNADGRDISCALLLLTSNPPKRALSFTLDTTRYVAIVTLTSDRPELLPAAQSNSRRYQ